MKAIVLCFTGVLFFLCIHAQESEFKTYSNNLIYSEATMSKLTHIVDSLNLKFKSCDLSKVFYSKQQTLGHIIKMDSGNIDAAVRDIKANISFEDFILKYPTAKVFKNELIVKFKYKDYEKNDVVEIEHFDLESDYGLYITANDPSIYTKDVQNTWLFKHYEKTSYSDASLSAFYFANNFNSVPLPATYNMMVGYTDCLIDTTSTKMKENLQEGWDITLPKNWMKLSVKEKNKLLDQMRGIKIIGGCSMDSRPREHAMNIALLSAETANWKVFLKAHLDIMNDRFDRMTDGSYAWEQRQTYIKELEELNINISDLILGIALRVENPAKNHYYGSIGRLGRALAETKYNAEIEKNILSAITDTTLDNYNRLLFYFLFKNYNYYIKNDAAKKINQERLAEAVKTLPEYFSSKLK